ncbi:GNAT family N-acetyltransferase [Fulvivirgaceae bacterium PWU4]|uniref:GNAT family N-acetyltransferase n=1 Tax=Chryseosolibacter histidini TaxID=2782349 RepID=A0AAP2DRJ9_9BACT|nr:GNAT family N-acetyltransferase [Chryseosolibacter histidini]MBT1701193.1 GNAT family N-acetyltransferase [Chryseosolibacter histidini]
METVLNLVDILPFAEPDRSVLQKLYLQVRQASFIWLDTSRFKLGAFDDDTKDELILVAKIGNKIVGFISAWIPDNFIHHLYVDNQYQHNGIGTKLLKEMVCRLQYPITLKCLKSNVSAIKFYERNQWHAKSEAVSEDGPYILFELSGSS